FPAGWLSNRVDALNRSTLYEYDAVGNLTKTRYLSLGTSNVFGYDAENRLYSMSDATGTSTLSSYLCGEYSFRYWDSSPWPNAAVAAWIGSGVPYRGYHISAPNGSPMDVIYWISSTSASRFYGLNSPGGFINYT